MSDDKMDLKLNFDIATKGEEKLDKLDKTVAHIAANLEKIAALGKAAGSVVSGFASPGRGNAGSTASTRNATRALRDQLGIDREKLRVAKMAARYRQSEASQAAKAAQSQERQARQAFKDKLTFNTRLAAQRLREDNAALRAVRTEQRAVERSFRQKMSFNTRMANQRAREEASAERDIQRGIRETGRLRQAEQRRALADHRSMQRERSRGLSQVRSGGGRIRDGARTVTGVGAAAGAGTVYAGQRAVRAFTSDAVDLDDAMNRNARMQPELGGPKLTGPLMLALREKFRPIAQSLGKTTAEMLNARAEVLQAGVESGIADEVTRVVTQFAVANELNASQVAESFGYGLNALSAGGAVTAERASKLMNVMQYLAANTPASRQQLASFTKRGLGAGAALRMSDSDTLAFGASATSAGADGETAARMLSSDNMKLANHVVEARDIQRKSHKSEQDRKFLALPSKLGFRDWDDLAGSMDTDAAGTIQRIYSGVRKAGTATEKLQILKSLFGENFGVFHATMAESGSFEKMRDAARNPEAARALEAAMEEVRTTIGFALIQLKNVFTELSATLGMVLKPLWSDLRDWVLKLSTGFGDLKMAFSRGVSGLLYGLGSKDGSLGSLLTEAFGDPAQMRLNIDAIFAFAHGFGEGIRSVITTVKAVFSTIGTILGASSPAEIGKLMAQFMGFATVLTLMAPAALVIGALSRGLLGLIEVIVGGARLVAGLGAGAGVAGALGGGGGAAAAAGGASAAAAAAQAGKWSGGLGALGLAGLAYTAKELSGLMAGVVDNATGTDPKAALSASGAQRFGFKSGGF